MSLTIEEYERLNPHGKLEHDGVHAIFAMPTKFTQWRVMAIYATEPWTLAWIAGAGCCYMIFMRKIRQTWRSRRLPQPRPALLFRSSALEPGKVVDRKPFDASVFQNFHVIVPD